MLQGTVRISRKFASELRELLETMVNGVAVKTRLPALQARMTLDRLMLPRRSVAALRKAKRAKDAASSEQTSAVYGEVELRANGRCECGCGAVFIDGHIDWRSEMDHFFSRREQETARTCWMLTAKCHRDRGAGRPTRRHWLQKFADHCDRHGFNAELRRALDKIPMADLKQTRRRA